MEDPVLVLVGVSRRLLTAAATVRAAPAVLCVL